MNRADRQARRERRTMQDQQPNTEPDAAPPVATGTPDALEATLAALAVQATEAHRRLDALEHSAAASAANLEAAGTAPSPAPLAASDKERAAIASAADTFTTPRDASAGAIGSAFRAAIADALDTLTAEQIDQAAEAIADLSALASRAMFAADEAEAAAIREEAAFPLSTLATLTAKSADEIRSAAQNAAYSAIRRAAEITAAAIAAL